MQLLAFVQCIEFCFLFLVLKATSPNIFFFQGKISVVLCVAAPLMIAERPSPSRSRDGQNKTNQPLGSSSLSCPCSAFCFSPHPAAG